MPLLNVIVGVSLLFFGRRIFWLFVAAVGFVVGAQLAKDGFGGRPEWLVLAVAVGVGVVGAVISVFMQRLLVGIAGFCAGGYILYTLALRMQHEPIAWIAYFAGGVVGVILVMVVFDWALIFLSVLTGATAITQSIPLDQRTLQILFVTLAILGIVVQGRQLIRETSSSEQGSS